jgi:hypothetical protein
MMRRHRHNANSVRIASLLRPDMIFRRDTGQENFSRKCRCSEGAVVVARDRFLINERALPAGALEELV